MSVQLWNESRVESSYMKEASRTWCETRDNGSVSWGIYFKKIFGRLMSNREEDISKEGRFFRSKHGFFVQNNHADYMKKNSFGKRKQEKLYFFKMTFKSFCEYNKRLSYFFIKSTAPDLFDYKFWKFFPLC